MDNNINEELNPVEKSGDTLLVLHHETGNVGIVKGLGENGEVNRISPGDLDDDEILSIERSENSFTDFYSTFYNQLKEPSEFSFFKVTEYEAKQTALNLQKYMDEATDDVKQELKKYEISIDVVEAHRKAREGKIIGKGKDTGNRYVYTAEQVDWKMMEKLGWNKERLEELGALEPMLKGYKTPMLVPVCIELGTISGTIEARLSLQANDFGEVELRFHPVRRMPDFSKPFFGHIFSEEDKRNLIKSGNMGRVVDLVHGITGESVPSLISRDRLTNELVQVRAEWVRIPLVIKGVTLDQEQRRILREGKPLYIENMLSARGFLFNAAVQYNADKRYVEFLLGKNVRRMGMEDFRQVPEVFRGKRLKKWQVEKLKNGEVAYVDGLVDRNGKGYQGYLRFDKRIGKFEFSFKNVWKGEKQQSRKRGRGI
ncbi:DUF3945 domain-containing protein [Chryseobacterium sediminis]|uniref:DUF3945 domain-containing protein n=1 Tax=Chryseobacterium sediminis TaxID=1679494 RepID=UPI002856D5CA|nr:DUF3945 domain-containing protein [Chryseobacterium sediminis]MDR6464592.1 hypothetical protein [Chryseobacterium sediminis]